ncbi:MAG TPA: sugar phosphate nucleotidyltransferase [Desulfatirhabdiaceae bacterium]|nr:sugar phosphate nucleotidyltransferase [Desulfatirhabdiaceae bacterium]
MKALILAAGFGTRLLPYSSHTPKPLFPIGGTPLLDRIIRQLVLAGCTEVMINTHYLANRIQAFLNHQTYPIPVGTIFEPTILGTGGAIRNLESFWKDQPFMVVNADIVTDIDLSSVYAFHIDSGAAATLVLTDFPEVNTVLIDADYRVQGFIQSNDFNLIPSGVRLTFTGIQVVSPHVIQAIPSNQPYSSINLYRNLISANWPVMSWIAPAGSWVDIGTPDRYHQVACNFLIKNAFLSAFGRRPVEPIDQIRLDGDGSDRRWHRIMSQGQSLILADHGIRLQADGVTEADAFIAIGTHLHQRGVSVPFQAAADPFSGLVFMEDLGDIHLQVIIQGIQNDLDIIERYQPVICELIQFAQEGEQGFDISWTYQTPCYDTSLILEKECLYFLNAFIKGYLEIDDVETGLQEEFDEIAKETMRNAHMGLMHRDMQSRNIMVHNGRIWFIDFQGTRIGPVQYDLASLLIDPYVNLALSVQEKLFNYYMDKWSTHQILDRNRFRTGYQYCCLTRNLQILGAFGYLTRVKNKSRFQPYIPVALDTLDKNLDTFFPDQFDRLKQIVSLAQCKIKETIHGIDRKTGCDSGGAGI